MRFLLPTLVAYCWFQYVFYQHQIREEARPKDENYSLNAPVIGYKELDPDEDRKLMLGFLNNSHRSGVGFSTSKQDKLKADYFGEGIYFIVDTKITPRRRMHKTRTAELAYHLQRFKDYQGHFILFRDERAYVQAMPGMGRMPELSWKQRTALLKNAIPSESGAS